MSGIGTCQIMFNSPGKYVDIKRKQHNTTLLTRFMLDCININLAKLIQIVVEFFFSANKKWKGSVS